jgi:hypothetical protein
MFDKSKYDILHGTEGVINYSYEEGEQIFHEDVLSDINAEISCSRLYVSTGKIVLTKAQIQSCQPSQYFANNSTASGY